MGFLPHFGDEESKCQKDQEKKVIQTEAEPRFIPELVQNLYPLMQCIPVMKPLSYNETKGCPGKQKKQVQKLLASLQVSFLLIYISVIQKNLASIVKLTSKADTLIKNHQANKTIILHLVRYTLWCFIQHFCHEDKII